MSDFVITLGGIAFTDFEVPEAIKGLGGKQMSTVHKLVGGVRIVDNMGRDDGDITWSGRFRGSDALSRARTIDGMRAGGAQQTLTFADYSLTVSVDEFVYDIERVYEVPYSLRLIVLSESTAAAANQPPGVDQMVASDNSWAQTLGAQIGDPTLTGLLGNLSSAVGAVPNLQAAAGAELQTILSPIAAAQGQVTSLIAQAETTLTSVTSLGGVAPGLPIPKLVANLQGQVAAMTNVASLYKLQDLL